MNIVYINLDRSTDRKEYMESQLRDLGLSAFRFSAIENNFDDFMIGNLDKSLSKSEQGCLLSHMNAIKMYNDDITLILEDDIDLSLMNKWEFSLDDLVSNLPSSWEVVQLYRYPKFLPLKINKRENNTKVGGSSCAAYLINPEYSKRLSEKYFLDGKVVADRITFPTPVAEYIVYDSESCYSTSIFSIKQMRSTINPQAPNRDVTNVSNSINEYFKDKTITLNDIFSYRFYN